MEGMELRLKLRRPSTCQDWSTARNQTQSFGPAWFGLYIFVYICLFHYCSTLGLYNGHSRNKDEWTALYKLA